MISKGFFLFLFLGTHDLRICMVGAGGLKGGDLCVRERY